MTRSEDLTVDDAAVLQGPSLPVGVQLAWLLQSVYIGASRRHLPAVSKLNSFRHHLMISGGEIVLHIAIIIPTKTTKLSLEDNRTKSKYRK